MLCETTHGGAFIISHQRFAYSTLVEIMLPLLPTLGGPNLWCLTGCNSTAMEPVAPQRGERRRPPGGVAEQGGTRTRTGRGSTARVRNRRPFISYSESSRCMCLVVPSLSPEAKAFLKRTGRVQTTSKPGQSRFSISCKIYSTIQYCMY